MTPVTDVPDSKRGDKTQWRGPEEDETVNASSRGTDPFRGIGRTSDQKIVVLKAMPLRSWSHSQNGSHIPLVCSIKSPGACLQAD